MNNGFSQEKFNSWLDEFESGGQPPAYPNPPQSIEEQINSLPNAEKLSGSERWLYEHLPGISQNKFVQGLSAFAESPVGQVLNVFDVLAEGAERTLGLLAQYRDMQPGDEFRLKDAWAAGSLFWDTARLPRVARDANGNFMGVQIDDGLPGAYALTEARKLLQEGKGFEEVKGALYDNLGALAMRAQMQDALGHIVVDPLSWSLGLIKPVQRLHAIRNLALTGKMDVDMMQAAETAARVAGNITEADKIAEAITQANKTGKALTRAERFVINLTGGTPYLEKTQEGYKLLDVSKQSKLQKFLYNRNPFALTPQARASELLDMMAANLGEHFVRPLWNSDPEEFIKAISSAAKGSIGGQWGHLAGTIQGRTVQALLASSDATIRELALQWKTYSKERKLFARLGSLVDGVDERQLWRMAKSDSKGLFDKVVKKANELGDQELLMAIQKGELTPKMFEDLGKIERTIPLLREEFYSKALVSLQDVAMRQSILQFGIKEKGVLTKWSDALKAWESLPFIKANPANAMRNLVNNDVTLVGRGLFGTMTPKMLDNFWKGKYIPPQFQRGFGLAGNESAAGEILEHAEMFDPGNAIKALEETLTGTETLADKVKEAAGKINLGIFDFSKFSAKHERAASIRASTNGWLEFHQQYWKPKTGFTSISKWMDSGTLDEMEAVMPGISGILDEVAQSSGADATKFAEIMQSGIEHNVTTIFKNAEESLGFKLTDALGTETVHRLQDGLPQAIKDGKVKEFIDGVRGEMETHVDDMFNRHIENLPGIIGAQVQAGGPLQFHRIFGKAVNEFWGGNTEHAIRMSTINELMDYAKGSGDWTKVNSLWNQVMADSEAHFGRVWKKFDAYQEGLIQGAKNAGIPYPKEVRSSFGEMKTGWERFFDYRNKAYREFFESEGKAGKDFEAIQKTLNTMYDKLAQKEDELYQRIDDLMVDSLPDPTMQGIYRNFRDQAAELRRADRLHTQKFYEKLRGARGEDTANMWSAYWKERYTRVEQIRQLEMRGSAAIQGDSESIQRFLGKVDEGEAKDVFSLAQQYGISSATKAGDRNNRRILNTVNKYLEEGAEKYKKVEDIPMDVAKKAFDLRAEQKAGEISQAATHAFIPDADQIFKDPMPIETALSEMNYGRGYAAMDSLTDEALAQTAKKSRLVSEFPEHIQKKINQWMTSVNDEMSSFRSAGVQYASFRRDSALLNYNRRTNFDNWIGHMAPFAFWTTHSLMNWGVHSLDRPAMFTSYLRTSQFLETAGLTDQNVPARLKGHIKIDLPFAPDWMGDTYVDPLRFMLPFDGFMQPWEQAVTSKSRIESKTKTTLEQMLEAGEISEKQYSEAVETQSGDAWDRAKATASEGGDDYDAMDFVSSTMTPHAPLLWAYNAAKGTPNEIGPFTPMSKTVKNLATMMGVEDWSNSPYNVEGRIRKSMGLPAYDKWQDYRVQREISNMAADGGYDMEKVREAMELAAMVESGQMESNDAAKQSELFKEATKRSNIESGGWFFGALGGIVGIPVKSYPTGEEAQRELGKVFSEAMQANEKGDPDALFKFFEDHPEYESRLALFKSPEERLKNFMVDNLWSRWNELPKLTQDEMKDQLGENFATMFLNKETRSYDTIKPEQLQIWLALTKGKQVGRLSATTEALLELNQLKLTEPETAWRVQTFYDSRKQFFENYYELQNGYYNKKEGVDRQKYLAANPQLREYWDFRRKFMEKNPDLVRFLTDDPKQLKKYENMQRGAPDQFTVPTAQEIKSQLSPEMLEILGQWKQGQDLPRSVGGYLQGLGYQYGLSPEVMMGIVTSP